MTTETFAADDNNWPSPSNPMAVARKLLEDYQHETGAAELLSWRGGWMEWCHSHWAEIEEHELRSAIYKRLEKANYKTKDKDDNEKIVPWAPNKYKVTNVTDAIRGITFLAESVDPPSWLTDPTAGEIVACQNGLLHVGTRELLKLTPTYFNRVAVPFDYDPNAPEPTKWFEFLKQLWPDDPDPIKALQEFFGYVVSGRTDLQKILLMIGPPRSGRGTIARVLTALIGKGNMAAPTLASLGTNFGLAPLIGKPLAVVGDARLGKESSAVVERLLSISGEDMLTIDRKFKEQWTGRLPSRFVILSNELPRFGDASGAIANRFIVLTTKKTFLGEENSRLTDILLEELPGILVWALDGLDRLTRQSFTTPKSSDDAIRTLQDLVSPISAFVRDECQRGPKCEIEVGTLYKAWKDWCEGNGVKPGSVQTFGGDLHAVIPELQTFRPHGQKRRYAGITLFTAHNGANRGSSGSEGQIEPREPHEPHENPLWAVNQNNSHVACPSCAQPLEQPNTSCSVSQLHAGAPS
jgi:putative DNA primase/helicase